MAKTKVVEMAPFKGPRWQVSNATYLAGQSHIDGADALAIELERKWGTGRLRLLVSADLREKFDRQRLKLNEAIQTGDVAEVQLQADRMCNAYRALDGAAEAAGASKRNPDVWECLLPDGSVAAVVPDNDSAQWVIAEGRKMAVYTLAEIANLLHGFPALVKAKECWAGATVTAVRTNIADPLEGMDRTVPNDELPWM